MTDSLRTADASPQPREAITARAARFLTEHFEDVLASLSEGLVILDRDGHVVLVSPAAEDLTGVSGAHAVGRAASQVFAGHRWISETLASCANEVRRTSEVGELVLPFGRRVHVHVAIAPILDAAGAAVGTLLLLRDLATLPRSLAQTAERGSRVGDLAAVAAGLAHEIKNPLGGIKGAAQLLAEELEGSESGQRFTSLITREVDRVSALLEQLLELTRPPRLQLTAVNVHRILREVLLLECPEPTRALTVRCAFDPSLPDIWADDAQLRQVFLNLTKNALDAMERAGTLTVTTRIETDFHVRDARRGRGQFLSVEIEDTGPGIPAEDCERIFTPFFTTKANGTGLGLAVSQRLVNQHGGLIQVDSEPGRGTRVRVSLPVATGREVR